MSDDGTTSELTLTVEVEKLQAYGAELSELARMSRSLFKIAASRPHPLDWQNPLDGQAEDYTEILNSARFFTDLAPVSPDSPTDEKVCVDLLIPPVRDWLSGLMAAVASGLLGELQTGETPPHRQKNRAFCLITAIQKFHAVTGITKQDLGMIREEPKVVQHEEFKAFKEGPLPWWVAPFCEDYGYSPAEALEAFRRFKEPEFKEEMPELYEAFWHCCAKNSWFMARECLSYIQSDPELGAQAMRLVEVGDPALETASANDISAAAGLLRHLAKLWKERHGEPPSGGE